MTRLEIVKTVASTIVGIGTSKIVYGIVANNVEIKNPVDQVTVFAGSFVAGSMAADATKKHTDKMIDDAAAWLKSVKQAAN